MTNNCILVSVLIILVFSTCQSNSENHKQSILNVSPTEREEQNVSNDSAYFVSHELYEILFPDTIIQRNSSISSPDGQIKSFVTICKPKKHEVYIVRCLAYPPEVFESQADSFDRLLVENSIVEIKKEYGLDTISIDENRLIAGQEGHYLQGKNKSDHISCFHSLHKNVLFQLVVSSDSGHVQEAANDIFFNSFRIMKNN